MERLHSKRRKLSFKLRKWLYVFMASRPLRWLGHKFATRRSKRFGSIMALIAMGGAIFASIAMQAVPVKAQSYTMPTSDLLEGTSQYGDIAIDKQNGSLSLENGAVGSWDQSSADGLQNLPTMVYGASVMAYGPNDTLYYATSFANACQFYVYEIEFKTWTNLPSVPVGCGGGAKLMYDNAGGVYYVPGNNSGNLYRYDIAATSWKSLASMPTQVTSFGNAEFVTRNGNSYIYLFRGAGSAAFWRYDVTNNSWDTMSPFPANSSVNEGISLAWDKNDTMYGYVSYTGEFKQYSITANTWTDMSSYRPFNDMRCDMTFADGTLYVSANRSGGEHNYVLTYDTATSTWDRLTVPSPANVYDWPPPVVYDGSQYIYTQAGTYQRPQLYRYDTVNATWNTRSVFPKSSNTGNRNQLIYDGGQKVYYVGGLSEGSTDRVYEYDLTTDVTTQIGGQFNTRNGFTGVYYNGLIYFLSSYDKVFQTFDPSTGIWNSLAPAPYDSTWGASIVDGGDGYLYSTFGGRTQFYRYNVASNTWQSRATLPATINSGGEITRINRGIYAQIGNRSGYFARYNMDTNTWALITPMPNGDLNHGAFMTGDGSRYIYSGTGMRSEDSNRRFFRYDTVTETWLRLADLPASVNVAASAFYDTTNSKVYVGQGRQQGKLWNWSPSGTNYVSSGTWYSKALDFEQVQNWTGFDKTVTGSGTSNFYTRTSSNGKIWSDWQLVSGSAISSPPNRYIMVKLVLSGSGSQSPVVSDLVINYDQEAAPPTLPAQFSAKSTASGANLVSGQTYEWQHPYFSWDGADDGANGSGIEGYYVYFGTASNADPVVQGNLQSSKNYTVTLPMVAGEVYYLRIKAVDRLGNVSAAATYFSYRYFYISPTGSVTRTSDADFNAGSNTDLTINNGELSLKKASNGIWATGGVEALPDSVRGGSATITDDFMYVMRGNNSTTFWRYNIVARSWETLANLPDTINAGSALTWDQDNYLYAVRGVSSNEFYRYDIQNDAWENLAVLPANAQQGTDIAYLGNNKIAVMFTGVREFYIYDTTDSSFQVQASYPSSVSYGGSGIWFDGDDTLYAYLGGQTWNTQSNNSRTIMAKYSVSSDTWRILNQPPAGSIYTQGNLVGDGNGKLYVFGSDQFNSGYKEQSMLSYSIANDEWSEIKGLPAQVYNGFATADNNRYVYAFPASNGSSRVMIRYDTWDKVFSPSTKNIDKAERIAWDTPNNSYTWSAGYAATSAYDGEKYVYVLSSDESTASKFQRYEPLTGDTITLPSPFAIHIGGSLSFIGDDLYYMRAGNSRDFYRFDMVSQEWLTMADLPSNAYRPGPSSLVSVGSTAYVMTGNGTGWYRYAPGANGGSWTGMANLPASVLNGSAIYDEANGSIYVLRGNGTTQFYRYNVSTNTWSSMASLPVASQYGSAMTISGDKIYAVRGSVSTDSYVYSIDSNTWSTGTAVPEPVGYGSSFIPLNQNTARLIPGNNSVDVWDFNYPASNRAYEGYAEHVSEPFEVQGMFDYADIDAAVDIPKNTKVEFWTRSSTDGTNWDDWLIAKQQKYYDGRMSVKVSSTARKFTQVKVMLYSQDNVYTPKVSSFKLSYYFDVDPPSNPTTINPYATSAKLTTIATNVWYNHAKPMFDWPEPGAAGGATDGPLGSNMAGYWVYFGPDETAIPRTAGTFVTSTDYLADLTNSGTYFLRIQAQDLTGNVDAAVYAPFVYKFDNTPPTTPSLITVTPGGYTTSNRFSYDWPAAFDAHAGVASYCYHTGATSGAFATEICQSGRNLQDLPTAYRTGTNVFYLRTLDKAGNYSSAYTTVSYYYSTDPPSPPTNMRAIPPSSPQNLFAFAWDLPSLYAGDPNQLSYCYSINVLPSATNTTCTSERFLAPFKAATQQGTNIIYMVTKDEAGNVNWNNYALANFIANTVSPGIPLNVVVNDTSDQSAGRWSLTVTWSAPTFEGNGIGAYIVERSEDGHSFEQIGNTSTTAFVDLTVEPDTTYYYRIRAADNVDNRGGPSGAASGVPRGNYGTPPTYVVAPTAESESSQASVKWATNRTSTSFVYYGTSPVDLSQSKGTLDLVTQHQQTITGLQPSTTYYYRVQSFDNERSYNLSDAYSQIYSFRTSESARVFNVSTDSITLNSGIVSWQTSVPTKTRIEYGQTLNYTSVAADETDSFSSNHFFKLASLASGTTYHYRIISQTQLGTSIYSDDYTLTTIARPTVRNIRFQPLNDEASTAVRVTWDTNVPTTSTLRYRGSGTSQEVGTSALVTNHEVVVRDLASSTEYIFNAEGRDKYGNLTTSEDQRWESSFDTRVPIVSKLNVSMTTTEGSSKTRAQLVVSWKTDEPSTSQVEYGKAKSKSSNKKSPFNADPTTNHVVVISDLDLAEIYTLKVSSRDLSGNIAYGKSTSVVTPDRETSVLDGVLTILQRVFRL